MKSFVIVLGCFLIVCNISHALDHIIINDFEDYVITFGKTYSNTDDLEKRSTIYRKNFEKIDNLNEFAKLNNVSFRLGPGPFMEYEHDEFVNLFTGLRFDNTTVKNAPVPSNSSKILSALKSWAPNYKSWVAEGKVTTPRYQGTCGGCWAFATVAVLESQYAIRYNKLESFSEQQLIDCDFNQKGGNWGCNGGNFKSSFEFTRNYGVAKNSDYPYHAVKSSCNYDRNKVYTFSGRYVEISNEEDLKTVVGTIGPVAVGIHASDYLKNYRHGILEDPTCSNKSPNHAVVVVGYGTENGNDYWLIKNSWGVNWGMRGFFKMARNKNMCNIAIMPTYAPVP